MTKAADHSFFSLFHCWFGALFPWQRSGKQHAFTRISSVGCRNQTRVLGNKFLIPQIELARLCFVFFAILNFSSDYILRAGDLSSRGTNIVFFLADDLGWTGLKCFGSDFYETPHLDRLAKNGMRFTDAYAACTVCSPTRAAIMTGLYPARIHLTDFIAGQNRPFAKLRIPDWKKGLDHDYVTIAEQLHGFGYRTALIGKWHLNQAGSDSTASSPESQGFDYVVDKPNGTKGYRLPSDVPPIGKSKREYLTDYLTDHAIRFLDESKSEPFFLYFAFHVPHTPISGRDDLVAAFKSKAKDDAIHNNPDYAAMVASMDESVGRIVERLEQLGLTDNTLVVFTSDNGGLTQRYGKHDGFTENLPLRRGKGSAYEGGVRVPTIIRWPGVTQPDSICHEPISSVDYYPTLLEVARGTKATQETMITDGRSLVPVLRNPTESFERDLFWHYPHYHAGGDGPYGAVRSGNWRLIEFYETGLLELYDLNEDIGEKHNLATINERKTNELHNRLQRWRQEVAAQMPTANPSHDPDRADQVRRR